MGVRPVGQLVNLSALHAMYWLVGKLLGLQLSELTDAEDASWYSRTWQQRSRANYPTGSDTRHSPGLRNLNLGDSFWFAG